ncbi:hypothetical protein DERP_003120 [Dermatophagoides pteronyssinus]|uniref:Uncharacterized protein n=1 Tax=Dermatophagoides pteronyssinus TaxID=6956 RepID=A0ABQ8JIP8_DERPT|nr:hypothetical protein DERP_003120 [Dermatophagoides pteronyssinus]
MRKLEFPNECKRWKSLSHQERRPFVEEAERLHYGGVQTPDSSPHGSPISSALNPQSNDIIYNNNNRFNQHSPRSFYHNHNNYTANSTTGQQLSSIGSMNNSIQSSSGRQTTATTLVMNDQISLTNPLDYPPPPPLSSLSQQGKGNSRETIKSLPTPELSWSTPIESSMMMNQTLYGYSSMYNHNNNIKNESKPELSMYTGNVYQSNDTNLYYGQNNFEIGGGDGRISNSNNDPNIAFHYGTNNNNNNSPGSNPIISNELHSDLISTSGNGGMDGTATSISSSLLTTATPTTTPTTTMNNYNHCDSSSNSELIAALAETREIIS